MKFYKALNVKPKNLEVKKAFIDCNAYYNDKIYVRIILEIRDYNAKHIENLDEIKQKKWKRKSSPF